MTTGRSRLRGSGGGGGCRRAGLRLRSQLGAGLGSGELSDCLLSLLGDRDGGEGGGTRRGFDVRSSPPASSQVATLTTTNSPWTTASKDLPASVARTWLMRKRSEEDRPSAPRRPEPTGLIRQALWIALETHGVSQHLIWILQLLYDNQRGQVFTDSGESREFDIRRGVRQGCVLSPRLFCSVLEDACENGRDRFRRWGRTLA